MPVGEDGMPVGEDGHDIEEFEECFDNGWCNYEWGYCDDQGECHSSDTGMIVDRNGMPFAEGEATDEESELTLV